MATVARGTQSNKVKLSQTSKNDELRAGLKGKDLGVPTIFAITDTVNPDYKMMWICQEKVIEAQQPTEVQKRFLGWDERDARLIRTGQAIKTDILGEEDLKAGDQLDGFDIKLVRMDFPAYDGQEPVINPTTDKTVLVNGKPVYEHRELVALD